MGMFSLPSSSPGRSTNCQNDLARARTGSESLSLQVRKVPNGQPRISESTKSRTWFGVQT